MLRGHFNEALKITAIKPIQLQEIATNVCAKIA